MIFSLIWIYHWFEFVDKGGLVTILVISIPYILSIIFMGMALSLLFKHREHAIMFLVFTSPIVLFISGLSWPTSSIPPLLHKLFYVFPSTHMVPAFLRVRTMGVSLADVKPEFMFLTFQMVGYFLLACGGFWLAMKKKEKLP
jgi:ABC-2 type transport system permease protein